MRTMTSVAQRSASRVSSSRPACRLTTALSSTAFQLLACVLTLGVALGCHGGGTFYSLIDDSRTLAADLRVQFNQAADAINRAVMADTEEASRHLRAKRARR
jgi:hypothetical protein